MEKKLRAAKLLLFMGMGLIALGLVHTMKQVRAEDITAEQLTQLAAALEGLTSCRLQCVNEANAARFVLLAPAHETCAHLKETQDPGGVPILRLNADYNQCLRDNVDGTAVSAIDSEESRCQEACLVTVMDPQGQGVSALAPAELDRDEVQLCQISCFTAQANFNVGQNCLDSRDQTSQSIRYCTALSGAHKSLCGRSCTDPAKFPSAQTVTLTHAGVASEDYAQCITACDEIDATGMMACIADYQNGTRTCPEGESWEAEFCRRDYMGLGPSAYLCNLLWSAEKHHCKFKCMSQYGVTEAIDLENIPADRLQ